MALIIRSSPIHAAGCYTTSRIRRGARVVEYTGPRLTVAEGDDLYENRDYTFLFGLKDGKHVIDGHGMAAFINHSCDPNCETEEVSGRVWIVAAREIAAGEELSYDYNLYDGKGDAPCSCGANACRGTMYAPSEIRRRQRASARTKAPQPGKKKKKAPRRG